MEHHQISKLLKNSAVLKSVTRKWIEVHDLSNEKHSLNKKIKFKTPLLRSDLCVAYIVVKGTVTVAETNTNNQTDKKLAFDNNAPFRCIWKHHHASQKSIIHSSTKLKILILLYQCMIC